MTAARHDVSDLGLTGRGQGRIAWAAAEMPVLASIRQRFEQERPLAGLRVSGCLHITTETANLARTLKAGGAEVVLCASNPLSTQDDVAAALVEQDDIPVFARRGEDRDVYYGHIRAALDHRPHITLDDGADLVSELHKHPGDLIEQVLGGTEETTTGVIRLRAMAADRRPALSHRRGQRRPHQASVRQPLRYRPERLGRRDSRDQHPGRGAGVHRGRLWLVRAGAGHAGKGHGARVIVTEVEPLRALEAAMDGFEVMPLAAAAARSDFIVTLTGDKHVLDGPTSR